MKNLKFILVAILAMTVGVVGCSKDETPDKLPTDGRMVSISLGDGTMATKAVDKTAVGQTTTFASGQLAFTLRDKVTAVYTLGSAATDLGDAKTVSINDITGEGKFVTFSDINADKVYVIGNKTLSELKAGSDIQSVLTQNALTVADLKGGEFENVVLFGSGDIVTDPANTTGGPSEHYAVVDVRPVSSRIEIEQVSDLNDPALKFDLAGIYINNYYKSLTINKTFGETDTNTATGERDYFVDKSQLPEIALLGGTFYSKVETKQTPIHKPTEGVWAFNIFPNQASAKAEDGEKVTTHITPHIILHFQNVEVTDGEPVKDLYVTIAKYSGQDEFLFKAGHVYSVENLKWDAKNDGGGNIELNAIECDVKVNVIGWIKEELKPEVN